MLNPYKTLQVDPNACAEVIHAAYRTLAKKHHPDKSSNNEERVLNEKKMLELNEAYSLVGKASDRYIYDREHAPQPVKKQKPAASTTPSTVYYKNPPIPHEDNKRDDSRVKTIAKKTMRAVVIFVYIYLAILALSVVVYIADVVMQLLANNF